MKHLRNFAFVALIALLSAAGVQPQQGTNTATYFEKAGVQFDVPTGWNATEKNLPGQQIVTIYPEKGPTQIILSAKNVLSCEFQEETKNTTTALVERVAKQIRSPTPIQFSVSKTQVNTEEIQGVSLLGVIEDQDVIADIYTFRVSLRLVSLVYIRAEKDEAAESGWNNLRTTLKVEHGPKSTAGTPPGATEQDGRPPLAGMAAADGSRQLISGGVLNGKAIRLPSPSYPPIARQAHAGGVVAVQVVIDETGAVIKANAVSGHPLLQAVSVAAAREAQFSPTKLCGEPVKVTGLITYHFVPR